jgi:hypothetical protein
MGLISNGTTVFDAGAMASGFGGSMVFIKKLTASSSATLSFVHGSGGVDFSTYKEYMFTFKSIHAESAVNSFNFNGSIDAGSNYNVAKTTTYFSAYLNENDSSATLEYSTSQDLAQATSFQKLAGTVSVDNDHALSGYLHLFNPSSTTFVKHFIWSCNYGYETGTENPHGAGYFNTTSDIDAVRFQMTSDAIDAGDICLYGIA